VLTNHQAHVVEQLVSSGSYQNASEVLREGLRLVEQREAELDYVEILSWTTKHFSKVQAQTYSETISQAIQALTDAPEILGSMRRDEIELGIRTLHVARL
jgi:Arc/MetJ-type ribon-helix-helix transcriptional regulator